MIGCLLLIIPSLAGAFISLPTTLETLNFYIDGDPYTPGFQGTPAPNYIVYGDFYSYSLPFLAIDYDMANGGGTGPGNPFYVASTPGAIKDDIVLYTGSSGKDVTTNETDMDGAYPSPSSKKTPFFSTESTADPGGPVEFIGDVESSWDTTLTAITNYLDGNQLIFFFNNNEEASENNQSQILQAWGKVDIVNDVNTMLQSYYFYANENQLHGYLAPYQTPDFNLLDDSTFDYYTISPGGIEVAYENDNVVDKTVNHNLGANQAAFALTSPDLNAYLAGWKGLDGAVAMQVTFYLGDNTENPTVGLGLSNGYEQLFIRKASSVVNYPIPEPGSLLLLGIGLLGLGVVTKRKVMNS